MFREIESIYKKESPYNKIVKIFIIVYFLSFVLLWIFGFFKIPYFAVLFVFAMIYAIRKIFEKILNKKIHLGTIIKYNDRSKLLNEIEKREIKIMRKYLYENRINNNICITSIIEYYRNKVVYGDNNIRIIDIINIIITMLVPFINNKGFDTKLLKDTFPYFSSTIIIVLLISIIPKCIFSLKKDFKGESYMYEQLEKIFSIILCENNKKRKKRYQKKINKYK